MVANFTDLSSITGILNISPVLLTFLILWILLWKGLALWKSARLNQPIWFIVLLVINFFGILEILYIFLFSRIKLDSLKEKTKMTRRENKKKR
jgi:methionyl-tRNA synthetase